MTQVVRTLSVLALVAGAGLAAGCGSQPGSATGKSITLAVVGSEKITSADLEQALANLPESYRGVGDTEKGKRQILDNLVKKTLLVKEAEERGLQKLPEVKKRLAEYRAQASVRLKQEIADRQRRLAGLDRQVFDNVMLSELNTQLKADADRLKAVADPDIEAYYQEYVQKLKVLNPAAQAPTLAAVEEKIRAILVEEQLIKQLEQKYKVSVEEDAFRQRYGEKAADVTIQDEPER
jgi:hypothetical protein